MRKSQGFLCRTGVFLAVAVPTVVALAGCGGGGGGAAPVVYKGLEDPAAITAANAQPVAGAVVTAKALDFPAVASFTKSGAAGPAAPRGLIDRFGLVHRRARQLGKTGEVVRGAVSVNTDCPDGGSVTLTAPSLSATTGVFLGTYYQCDLGDGFVINGTVRDTVTESTATRDAGNVVMNLSMSFGGLSYLFVTDVVYDFDGGALRDVTTGRLEYWDVAADEGIRIEDMDVTETYADVTDWGNDCVLTEDYTMTVYDAAYGSVALATTTPLIYTVSACVNPYPSSGGPLVLTGDAGATVTLTPVSTTQVDFEVDEDGDTVPEVSTTLNWADL